MAPGKRAARRWTNVAALSFIAGWFVLSQLAFEWCDRPVCPGQGTHRLQVFAVTLAFWSLGAFGTYRSAQSWKSVGWAVGLTVAPLAAAVALSR